MDVWTDHSVDKALAGWPHAKSFSQWPDVHEETSDKWHPGGVGPGATAGQYLCQ